MLSHFDVNNIVVALLGAEIQRDLCVGIIYILTMFSSLLELSTDGIA
jgi:hypothetical protein